MWNEKEHRSTEALKVFEMAHMRYAVRNGVYKSRKRGLTCNR
jgi:hypothetical protein